MVSELQFFMLLEPVLTGDPPICIFSSMLNDFRSSLASEEKLPKEDEKPRKLPHSYSPLECF